ncbi:hypothetical protein P3X46_014658 [Hevea brasiliensis]|uniref:NAD-dependent epimerase/dehydratase domain-containing protein n=1 Tax=Hevea brasiliensis TaxID=3981 RepID=A0ABQ9LVB5_HEVBR|nr:vestitone reductase-like [Hevea brasiliensis]KAJ9171268.1 hypothetical protein P3X46_014658 [Hevea brasiliensis]
MEGGKGLVCVTGGTGFIASWLIMRLLESGYTVRATVRPDPERKKDISYLTNLPGAAEKLQIFYADLEKPDSFNEAIQGCSGVFHLAHPVEFSDKEQEEAVTKRSVEATIGILKACIDSKTVKRVVYTSSTTAVLFSGNGQEMVDESAWTDVDLFRSANLMATSYVAAKTKTERAAIEFAEENGMDLVTVVPSLVVGSFICSRVPSSVYMGLALILGNKDQYSFLIKSSMVHVDDVARAHIFLFECPNAKGRYICSSDEILLNEMSEFLSARYPHLQIPTPDSLKDIKGYEICSISSKKLLDCGFTYQHGLGDMFDGAIQSCKEKGLI